MKLPRGTSRRSVERLSELSWLVPVLYGTPVMFQTARERLDPELVRGLTLSS
jgi:hypothetical protein